MWPTLYCRRWYFVINICGKLDWIPSRMRYSRMFSTVTKAWCCILLGSCEKRACSCGEPFTLWLIMFLRWWMLEIEKSCPNLLSAKMGWMRLSCTFWFQFSDRCTLWKKSQLHTVSKLRSLEIPPWLLSAGYEEGGFCMWSCRYFWRQSQLREKNIQESGQYRCLRLT